nr:small acid-soluble spore protein SspI [Paenibacillus polymyxa]
MPITMDLRQAIVHKVHGKSEADLTDMIIGSVDGPEAALPGLGVILEIAWKHMSPNQQHDFVHLAHEQIDKIKPVPLTIIFPVFENENSPLALTSSGLFVVYTK